MRAVKGNQFSCGANAIKEEMREKRGRRTISRAEALSTVWRVDSRTLGRTMSKELQWSIRRQMRKQWKKYRGRHRLPNSSIRRLRWK